MQLNGLQRLTGRYLFWARVAQERSLPRVQFMIYQLGLQIPLLWSIVLQFRSQILSENFLVKTRVRVARVGFTGDWCRVQKVAVYF